MRQILLGYNATINELVMHRDLKMGNIMVHFNNKTTFLMDMPENDKYNYLAQIDLD